MSTQERLIWFKRKLVSSDKAMVPVLSPTAQFGLNVFEGIRGYWSKTEKELFLFRLPEHLERLKISSQIIGIQSPYSSTEISQGISDVLKANKYECDVAVRVTLFVDGEGSWSSSHPVDMFIAPIAKERNRLTALKVARGCISTWERIDDRAMPPRVKAGANYINGRYAQLEAKAAGYDFPILLNRDGKISEGAGSCVMIVRKGVLITPPPTSSVLESITRETLLILAEESGFKVEVRPIDRTELYCADEVFLCGSAAEITPLTSIDQHIIGQGQIGTVTQSLLRSYQDAASGGRTEWLTPVWQTKEIE